MPPDFAQSAAAATAGTPDRQAETTTDTQLRQLFAELDHDDSGELEREEVQQLMERMGKRLKCHELDGCMREMDPDGSGTVDYDEFSVWWEKSGKKRHSEVALRQFFASHDADGSGELDAEEVRTLSEELGKKLNDRELGKAMAEMDEDGDGAIGVEEFLNWWWRVGSKRYPARFQLVTPARTEMNPQQLRDFFDDIDADGSGELDREEVVQLAKRLGKDLTEDELELAMSEMDIDGDDQVSFLEFQGWWEKFGKHRKGFVFMETAERLSADMEKRATLDGGGDTERAETSPAARVSRRARLKQQMRALQGLRWGGIDPSSLSVQVRVKKEAIVRSVAARREELGLAPTREVLALPLAGTAGPAALALLAAKQAVADAQWQVALLEHRRANTQLDCELSVSARPLCLLGCTLMAAGILRRTSTSNSK